MMLNTSSKLSTPSSDRRVTPTTGSTMRSSFRKRIEESSRSPSPNDGLRYPSLRSGTFRNLIGIMVLINMAMICQAVKVEPMSEDGKTWEKTSWTLVARKISALDQALSTINVTYNRDGASTFRLADKTQFYFSKAADGLELTKEDHDKENNCVRLSMNAKTWKGKMKGIRHRCIFYLDQDGPDFIEFLYKKKIVRGLDVNDFKRASPGQDEKVIGYTVALMKDNKMSAFGSLFGPELMKHTTKLRVHMDGEGLNRSIRKFDISKGGFSWGNCGFEIQQITDFTDKKIKLKLNRAADVRNSKAKYRADIQSEDRWLYFADKSDSKRFLLFLMENYDIFTNAAHCTKCGQTVTSDQPDADKCSNLKCSNKGKGWKEKMFSDTTAAALKTYFKRTEQASAVKEWIDPEKPVYGLVNLDNAPNFTAMCGGESDPAHDKKGGEGSQQEGNPKQVDPQGQRAQEGGPAANRQTAELPDGRRRLVEAAYYSFIGFNMLLMCCLLVGISFAYHIGTHAANYEPIRW